MRPRPPREHVCVHLAYEMTSTTSHPTFFVRKSLDGSTFVPLACGWMRTGLKVEAIELSERMRHVTIPSALSPASSPMGSRYSHY